ncbi:MAG TPA: penicillin-binding transpeptidase domain-containing protein [Candidatus Subteraquimicrobiales bacterium]
MDRRIKHLALFFMAAFLLLIIDLTYLQIFAAEKITSHPKNTRDLQSELQVPRGKIISSDGKVLAKNKRVGLNYARVYPFGNLTSAVIGFNSVNYGRTGLEQTFNGNLLGKKKVATIEDYINQIKEERIGNDLFLTLDTRLQQAATEALGDKNGAVVVLEPKTGEILSMVTYPRYDPNNLKENWKSLVSDPETPLINRSTQGLYPPGSSFKVVTSAAALETETVTPDKVYDGPKELRVYGGRVTNYADQGFGEMPFQKALAVSCNTIFAQVGLELGAQNLVKFARKFGLNRDIPFELPVERSKIPSPRQMDKLELAWSAVGQGRILVTPLEIALVGAAIANDGEIMRPRLVKEIRDYKGNVLDRFEDKVWVRPVSRETAQTLGFLMVKVVDEGSGRRAKIAGISVAGKTGTAEPADKKRTHAWFVGFAPADDPQVVVAVVVEHAGVGGAIAAPIAKKIMEAALELVEN